MELSKKELFGVVVVLALIATCTFLLLRYDSMFVRQEVAEEDAIATTKAVNNTPQRKLMSSFSYWPLIEGHLVGNGDRIFTSGDSSARILFNNGSLLLIGPNSLVEIRIIDDKIDLFLEHGNLSGKLVKDSEMDINTKTETMTLVAEEPVDFKLTQYSDTGITLTEYKSGKTAKKNTSDNSVELDQQVKAKTKPGEKRVVMASSDEEGVEAPESNELMKQDQLSIEESVQDRDLAVNYDLPYPKNNTLFLYKDPTFVYVVPIQKCFEGCEFSIKSSGGFEYKTSIPPGKNPGYRLNVGPRLNTKIEWKLLQQGKKELTGLFFIRPMSDRNMEEGIKDKMNIEVLN